MKSRVREIRKKLLMAISMLEAARSQKPTQTARLLRMDGGISLAQGYIDEAKHLLMLEMDEHEESKS